MDKVLKRREMYILQYGVEPKSVIVGYEVLEEIKRKFSERYDGATLYGMRVYVDDDRPTRVEVGNIRG